MTGTTPNGFPYVTGTDAVADYPATSLALANRLDSQSTWQAYTPTILGTGFVMGASVLAGRYAKQGRSIRAAVWFMPGSGANMGTGTFTVSLPFPVAAGWVPPGWAGANVTGAVGHGYWRTNAGIYLACEAAAAGGDTGFTVLTSVPNGTNPNLSRWAGNSPAGQTMGDRWQWLLAYETDNTAAELDADALAHPVSTTADDLVAA